MWNLALWTMTHCALPSKTFSKTGKCLIKTAFVTTITRHIAVLPLVRIALLLCIVQLVSKHMTPMGTHTTSALHM